MLDLPPIIMRFIAVSYTHLGENVTNQPEHIRAKRIGRVFQDPMRGTAGDMWIEENLAIAVRRGKRRGLRWGVTKEERELFKELLSPFDLGLEDRLQTKVSLLSGCLSLIHI